jgi:hypothetical protein
VRVELFLIGVELRSQHHPREDRPSAASKSSVSRIPPNAIRRPGNHETTGCASYPHKIAMSPRPSPWPSHTHRGIFRAVIRRHFVLLARPSRTSLTFVAFIKLTCVHSPSRGARVHQTFESGSETSFR